MLLWVQLRVKPSRRWGQLEIILCNQYWYFFFGVKEGQAYSTIIIIWRNNVYILHVTLRHTCLIKMVDIIFLGYHVTRLSSFMWAFYICIDCLRICSLIVMTGLYLVCSFVLFFLFILSSNICTTWLLSNDVRSILILVQQGRHHIHAVYLMIGIHQLYQWLSSLSLRCLMLWIT